MLSLGSTKMMHAEKLTINVVAFLGHVDTAFEDLLHLTMQFEPLRDLAGLLSDGSEDVDIHSRWPKATVLLWALEARPPGTEPILWFGDIRLGCLVVCFVGL